VLEHLHQLQTVAFNAVAPFANDGWLATGDVGRLGSDGYLTIVDRRRSLIITGGYNVYPAEAERVIQQLRWVAEVAVIGIPDEH
jgi:acyl-CoA synthetase (AMP-forming)/AMP-acid ligase II